MNAPAVASAPLAIQSRRFDMPDLDRCGIWLMPRLKLQYEHLNERGLVSWLRSIMYSNEFLFLCREQAQKEGPPAVVAVALAQCMSAHTLQPNPIIEERFVWVRDPDDKAQLAEAACFYTDFAAWAKRLSAEAIIVEEMTDVPHEMVKEKLGRIFQRQQQFAKV